MGTVFRSGGRRRDSNTMVYTPSLHRVENRKTALFGEANELVFLNQFEVYSQQSLTTSSAVRKACRSLSISSLMGLDAGGGPSNANPCFRGSVGARCENWGINFAVLNIVRSATWRSCRKLQRDCERFETGLQCPSFAYNKPMVIGGARLAQRDKPRPHRRRGEQARVPNGREPRHVQKTFGTTGL